jgi:hypothetical protein
LTPRANEGRPATARTGVVGGLIGACALALVAAFTPPPAAAQTGDIEPIAAIVLAVEGRWSVERAPGVEVFVGQLLERGTVLVASDAASHASVRLALFHGQELWSCQVHADGRQACAERLAVPGGPDAPRLTSPLGVRLARAAPHLPDALLEAALLARAAGGSAGLTSAPALCTASGLDLSLLFPNAPPGDYSLALRTEGEASETRCAFTHPRRHLCAGDPRSGFRPCRPGTIVHVTAATRGWTALAAALTEEDFLAARGELREFRAATAGWTSRNAVAALLNALVREWSAASAH